MKSFPKLCVLICFSILLLQYPVQTAGGQNYLNLHSQGDFISIGLEENVYAFADAEFRETWHATFKTSLYTESLSRQLFIASLHKEFVFGRISVLPSVNAGGKYYDGIHFAGCSVEANYNSDKLVSVGINPILLYFAGALHFRFQTGGTIKINKSGLYCYAKYGPPLYLMNSENNLTMGLIFSDARLRVSAGLQVPDSFNFKYTRVVSGFIYSFKKPTK